MRAAGSPLRVRAQPQQQLTRGCRRERPFPPGSCSAVVLATRAGVAPSWSAGRRSEPLNRGDPERINM